MESSRDLTDTEDVSLSEELGALDSGENEKSNNDIKDNVAAVKVTQAKLQNLVTSNFIHSRIHTLTMHLHTHAF
jgi:hypothetical protein